MTLATVPALLAQRAAASPEAPAFASLDAQQTWQFASWGQFHARVQVLAQGLHGAGLRHGDRFALIAPVSLEWELLHHAALAVGAVVVGLDAHDLPQRIAAMVEQADIRAFATSDPRVLAALTPARLAAAAFWLAVGPAEGAGPVGLRRIDWSAVEAPGATVAAAFTGPAAGDVASVIFTSGTTGAPRGIPYRHDQLCLAVDSIAKAFPFVGTDSRLVCWLPLSNLFQRIVNLAGMRRGAVTHLVADPRRVMALVQSIAPDVFIGVPRFYEKLHEGILAQMDAQPALRRRVAAWAWAVGREAAEARAAGASPSPWLRLRHALADRLVLHRVRSAMGPRLRCMVTGSAPMPRQLLTAFEALGWRVLEAYGLSENVVPMAMNSLDACRPGSVGRPLPSNELRIGPDGAIAVRGPGVFAGYLGVATPALGADGFYATGDLGHLDAAGFLYLTGRSGDILKTSTGRRVAPVAIEACLTAVPGIDQAVLVGNGRKFLVALASTTLDSVDDATLVRLQQGLHAGLQQMNETDRPLAVGVLLRPFSMERGELTPNLKLRRGAIEAAHSAVIDQLYALAEAHRNAAASALPQLLVTEDRIAGLMVSSA